MSVPASRRKETTLQFVMTARNIASDMLLYVVRMPKKFKEYISDPMFEACVDLVKHVQIVRRVYLQTIELEDEYANLPNIMFV